MALLHLDGFDVYGVSADLNGTPYILGDNNSLLEVGTGRGGGNAIRRINNDSDHIGPAINVSISAGNDYIVGFANFANAAANPGRIVVLQTYTGTPGDNNNEAGGLTIEPDGSIMYRRGRVRDSAGSNTVAQSAPNVYVRGAWNYIEARITHSNGATGNVIVRVNGVEVINVSSVQTSEHSGTVLQTLRWGVRGQNTGTNSRHLTDDLYVCDTTGTINNDFLGDLRVVKLEPNADTAQADFALSSGANGFSLLTSPQDGDGGYIESNVVGAISEFDFEDIPFTPSLIAGIALYSVSKKVGTGIAEVRADINSNSVIEQGTPLAQVESYAPRFDVFGEDPDGNIAWTEAKVNAIKARVERTA